MSDLPHLTDAEAAARRAAGQGNPPPPPSGRSYWRIVRENVFTFINNAIFLLGIGLVLVGRPMDALISVGIIMTNVVVSVRAGDTREADARPDLAPHAADGDGRRGKPANARSRPKNWSSATRSGSAPGDQVLVDGEVIRGAFQVDESQLTGESDLLRKDVGAEVFSGSFCASGAGYFTVTRVGQESVAGQLAAGARAYRRVLTPLQQEINLTIRVLLLMVIYLEILLVLNGVMKALPLPQGVQQATVDRRAGAERPVRGDRSRLRARRGADRAAGRAGPAVQRDRVAEQCGRAMSRQDGHADDQQAEVQGCATAWKTGPARRRCARRWASCWRRPAPATRRPKRWLRRSPARSPRSSSRCRSRRPESGARWRSTARLPASMRSARPRCSGRTSASGWTGAGTADRRVVGAGAAGAALLFPRRRAPCSRTAATIQSFRPACCPRR